MVCSDAQEEAIIVDQTRTNKASSEKVLQECKDTKAALWADMQDDTGWSFPVGPGVAETASSFPCPKPKGTPKPKASAKGKAAAKNPTVARLPLIS